MRGATWEYLSDWAVVTLAAISCVWLLACLVGCAESRAKKGSACSSALTSLLLFLRESALIIIHLLTVNEMTLYAFASFKIILTTDVNINYGKLLLSISLAAYYLLYLVRLIVAAFRFKGKEA